MGNIKTVFRNALNKCLLLERQSKVSFTSQNAEKVLNAFKQVQIELTPEQSQEYFAKLLALDPTTSNDEIGKYANWLLKQLLKFPEEFTENLFISDEASETLYNALDKYNRSLSVIPANKKDINGFKTIKEFENFVQEMSKSVKPTKKDTLTRKRGNGWKVVKEDSTWMMIEVTSFEAWRYWSARNYLGEYALGIHSVTGKDELPHWCTTASGEQWLYYTLNNTIPKYMMLNKEKPEFKHEDISINLLGPDLRDFWDDPLGPLWDTRVKSIINEWLTPAVFEKFNAGNSKTSFFEKISQIIKKKHNLTCTYTDDEFAIKNIDLAQVLREIRGEYVFLYGTIDVTRLVNFIPKNKSNNQLSILSNDDSDLDRLMDLLGSEDDRVSWFWQQCPEEFSYHIKEILIANFKKKNPKSKRRPTYKNIVSLLQTESYQDYLKMSKAIGEYAARLLKDKLREALGEYYIDSYIEIYAEKYGIVNNTSLENKTTDIVFYCHYDNVAIYKLLALANLSNIYKGIFDGDTEDSSIEYPFVALPYYQVFIEFAQEFNYSSEVVDEIFAEMCEEIMSALEHSEQTLEEGKVTAFTVFKKALEKNT